MLTEERLKSCGRSPAGGCFWSRGPLAADRLDGPAPQHHLDRDCGVLLGVVFLVAGINEVGMAALAPGGWKVWHYIMAGIFLLGGLWGFIRPVNTFFALASVLGLILVFYGAFEIVRG